MDQSANNVTFWATILTSIITVFGSGLVVAVVTHVMQTGKEQRELKRQKLECLCETLTTYMRIAEDNINSIIAFHEGKLSVNDIDTTVFQETGRRQKEGDKASIIADLYFPRLSKGIKRLREFASEVIDIGYDFEEQTHDVNPNLVPELLNGSYELEAKFEDFRENLTTEALFLSRPFSRRIEFLLELLWR